MHRIRITPEAEIDQLEQVSELITRCAQKALEMENAPEHSFVDVTIVDNETIRTLNRENRGKDAVTDVLSFPMLEFYNGEWPEDVDMERDPGDDSLFLGDMILNYDRAVEQAKEYGHSVERECGFLTVHSMMHLLGYDHERSEEERQLQRKQEEAVLESLVCAAIPISLKSKWKNKENKHECKKECHHFHCRQAECRQIDTAQSAGRHKDCHCVQ